LSESGKNSFFADSLKTNIMQRKLTRSNNQMIAGVCAGIAEYVGWDITLVRVIYAILSVFSAGFPGLLLYIILWIVMPRN
jgi:phage shock protein PspC (stress-responsive transcriptional regulator)